MNSNLAKTNNELIRKRRKKKAIKRSIIFAILLVAVAVTLCLKLTYFNVSSVKVSNNNIISSDEIIKDASINIGTNIFYINLKEIKTNVLKNPYIESVSVKRIFPNAISISVKEREAKFYGESGGKYFIIDKNGIVLEESQNLNKMNLTSLLGFNFAKSNLGAIIPGADERSLELIAEITDLITLNTSGVKINSVDLGSSIDIKVQCENMTIKLGDGQSLKQKLNKAINIIKENNLISQKGYVDVSFNGNPVIYIEKQEDKE